MTDFGKGTETQYPSTAQESCFHVLPLAYLPAAEVSGGGRVRCGGCYWIKLDGFPKRALFDCVLVIKFLGIEQELFIAGKGWRGGGGLWEDLGRITWFLGGTEKGDRSLLTEYKEGHNRKSTANEVRSFKY